MKYNVFFTWNPARSALRALAPATWLLVLVTTMMLGGLAPALAQDTNRSVIYLAGSGNITLNQYVQRLLEERLASSADLTVISDEQAGLIEGQPIVTVGPEAFARIRRINPHAPVLALLANQDIPRSITRQSSGQVSAIYHGAPLLKQALLGKSILPQATRISLISTTRTADLYEKLIDQLEAYNLEARLFVVDNERQLIPTLSRALSYGDFLLAAPDDAIYNPTTIKHVLLTAYRRNKIVIGPSQAYVKAGALASAFTPFPAMAEAAVSYLKTFFSTGAFPPPAYPSTCRVEINQQVARSLNIPVGSPEDIANSVELRLQNPGEQDND